MTFVSALAETLTISDPIRSADAAHDVVINEIKQLDPDAGIVKTHYFNHSFVPDLVVRWSEDAERLDRPVFLRFSVDDEAFAQDLLLARESDGLFVGMLDGPQRPPRRTSAAMALDGSLVARADAIDEFDRALEVDPRTAITTSGLVRRGRGFMDVSSASRLTSATRSAFRAMEPSFAGALAALDQIALASSEVSQALATVNPYLSSIGQSHFEQLLQTHWVRAGHDPFRFPGVAEWDPGGISRGALRDVILNLVSRGEDVPQETWRRIVGHISAEEIGRFIRTPVRDAGFDDLVSAVIDSWTAQWVWVDDPGAVPFEPSFAWMVDNRMLGLDTGDARIFFADDGRHFKDKPRNAELPTLSECEEILNDYQVVGVALRTSDDELEYRRRLGRATVGARVAEILADEQAANYRVESLTVVVPGMDWTAEVSFARRMIDVNERPTPIRTLAQLAYRYFSRAPADWRDELKTFLK